VLHGADPDQRGPGRITPLIAAVIGRQVEVADELIELGADPSLRDAQGWSALDYAALGGDPELLRLVLPTRDAAFDERPDGVPSMLLLFCLLSLHDEQIRARRHESEEAMFPPFESMIAAWKEGRWNQEMFSGLLEQLNSQEDAFDDEDGDALTEDEEHELLEELLALEVSAEAEPPAPIPSFAAAACIDPPEDLSEHDVPADDLVPLSVDVAEPASDATAVEVVPSTPVLAPRAERDGRRQGTMAVVSTVSCRLRRAENDGPASERIEAAKAVVFDWLRTDKRLPLPATVPAEYQLDLATGPSSRTPPTRCGRCVSMIWTSRHLGASGGQKSCSPSTATTPTAASDSCASARRVRTRGSRRCRSLASSGAWPPVWAWRTRGCRCDPISGRAPIPKRSPRCWRCFAIPAGRSLCSS
jgi:hypothetical protein